MKPLRKDDVDWSQTRVMIVASAFTKFQREALALKNLPIELWEVGHWGNGDYEVLLYGSGYIVHFEYVLSLIRKVLERMR